LMFSSLRDVVKYYGDALKYPFKNQSNDASVQATTQILQWKKDRSKQMEAVERIVEDLFDVTKEMPYIEKKVDEKDTRVDAIISRLFSSV